MGSLRRAAAAVAATAVVLAGGALVVDSVSASRIEADLSERIRPATPGVAAPAVTVGGGPGSRWTGPDRLDSVSVRAEGVGRPAVGPVTVEADATGVHVPPDHSAPPSARDVTVSVNITGDALGRALGMHEMLLAAADDPSLAGGTEHRARVTGTLDGTDTRVSAFVDLVVDDRGARLVPASPATGPAGLPDQDRGRAMHHTALTLPPDLLPLGADIDTLTVRGSTIVASGSGGADATPLDRLAAPAL